MAKYELVFTDFHQKLDFTKLVKVAFRALKLMIIGIENTNLRVLLYYLHTDFHTVEKPKGGPLEIEKFFVEGVNERGWRGVRSLLKPSSAFIINEKINFLNLVVDKG